METVRSVSNDAGALVRVMPGPGPGIHDLNTALQEFLDGRARPGHDDERMPLEKRYPQRPSTALAMMFFWISLEPP